MKENQKWIKENGIYYPFAGDTTMEENPGMGIFHICNENHSGISRLGLRKIADEFLFNFKVYDLEVEETLQRIEKTWNSDIFKQKEQNLGVIFNGLKGTGKTIAAKTLCNRLKLPVIIINESSNELQNFIQSLNFECIIMIDEAEKTFYEEDEVLLKIIDGIYNKKRKLYILTTNNLTIDDNLLGRPGRIRYIKEFGNLKADVVMAYVKDNLNDASKTKLVYQIVDSLEISTIDILRAIVDDINIHGDILDENLLNIPKSKNKFEIICFDELKENMFDQLKEFIKSKLSDKENVKIWLNSSTINQLGERISNTKIVDDEFESDTYTKMITSNSPYIIRDIETSFGTVSTEPDKDGFFIIKHKVFNTSTLCFLISSCGVPSFYEGKLIR